MPPPKIAPRDDVFWDILWHSSAEPGSGNQISSIVPKAANCIYIVIKIEPTGYNVTLTKTSTDATVTSGNDCYSLAGATYGVYTDSNAMGTPVAIFTANANGHAELARPLGNGTYYVKETKASKGYKLVKKDRQAGQSAQGSASLEGVVYRITYKKNDQTVTFHNPKIGTTATMDGEKTTDPLGQVTITDTVTYIGLTPGKEYTIKGVLMDKSTKKKLLVDGKEVTAEAAFTAPKAKGSIDIPFTFDLYLRRFWTGWEIRGCL